MAKNISTTYMTADDFDKLNSPDISEPRRKSSITNPFRSFKDFKQSEKLKRHTADPNTNVPAVSSLEQDNFNEMLRVTQGMSPDEVKAFLAKKTQADQEKYKDDTSVGGLLWNKWWVSSILFPRD